MCRSLRPGEQLSASLWQTFWPHRQRKTPKCVRRGRSFPCASPSTKSAQLDKGWRSFCDLLIADGLELGALLAPYQLGEAIPPFTARNIIYYVPDFLLGKVVKLAVQH